MSRTIFPPKRLGETKRYSFDFTSVLPFGETVQSAAAYVFLYSGTDANPTAMLTGAVAISAGKVVSQAFGGGVAGNIYTIQIQATLTPSGAILQMTGQLAVLPDQP